MQLLQPARDPQARKGKQGMKCHLELFETTKDNNKRRKREESEQASNKCNREVAKIIECDCVLKAEQKSVLV